VANAHPRRFAPLAVVLREVVGAGEPLNPEIIERVRSAWGLTIRDGFGQTETTAQIGNPPGQLLNRAPWANPCQAMPSPWWPPMKRRR